VVRKLLLEKSRACLRQADVENDVHGENFPRVWRRHPLLLRCRRSGQSPASHRCLDDP
jgi:hypothetical protein